VTRALVPILTLAAALSACGGGDGDSSRIRSGTLTIYSSTPRHGISAAGGDAVFAGQRRALRDAGGHAGGRRVRLVRLSSTRPGDSLWDPGTVEANAQRARKDPSAVAYLGELDFGGSAISLPVTNRARLLQVSPTDGLTSLTRTPPGRPRAGPERYYPEGVRSFVRLVPSDLMLADGLLSLLKERSVAEVALVHGNGIAGRELAAVLASRIRRGGAEPAFAEPLPDQEDALPAYVERIAAARPDVVVHLGARGLATSAALAALGRRLPRVRVLGSTGLAAPGRVPLAAPREVHALTGVLPASAQPAAGRRLLRSLARERGGPVPAEALYGYEAMSLVLAAIDRAGPDRRAVIRAALAPRHRHTVLGRLSLARNGDLRGRRLALLDLRGHRRTLERVLP
jgi:branched-chain amino acid transport system substrate-binding protein